MSSILPNVDPPYKIVFMGTPLFAKVALEALYEEEQKTNLINIVTVVTQPDKPKGRGKKITPPEVKEFALKIGKPILQPFKLSDPEVISTLKSLDPDFFVVAAYGKILPKTILEIPKVLPINIHASILPKYRGAAPINWALINGDTETGITIMAMDEGMDTGPIILQESINILWEDNLATLTAKMAKLGAKLIVDTFYLYKDGKLSLKPQPAEGITYAPPLKGEYHKINWNEPASKIANLIRACDPEPGAYSYLKDERYSFFNPSIKNERPGDFEPGQIVDVTKDEITIACGEGFLAISELQRQSKKRLKVSEFLKGNRLELGQKFTSEISL